MWLIREDAFMLQKHVAFIVQSHNRKTQLIHFRQKDFRSDHVSHIRIRIRIRIAVSKQ